MAIKNILLDLDETLIHTQIVGNKYFIDENEAFNIQFRLNNDPLYYLTWIRKEAQKVIDFSREVVGYDNVFLFTRGASDYAAGVNEHAKFGFTNEQILWREKWSELESFSRWEKFDADNILVDNEKYVDNMEKIVFSGVAATNYLNCRNFFGAHFQDFFGDEVIDFIKKRL